MKYTYLPKYGVCRPTALINSKNWEKQIENQA